MTEQLDQRLRHVLAELRKMKSDRTWITDQTYRDARKMAQEILGQLDEIAEMRSRLAETDEFADRG